MWRRGEQMIVRSTRGPWRRRSALGVAVVSMLALLAACGGGGSSSKGASPSSGSSGTTEPTQPAPTGTPLKLGFILDKSGPNGPGQGDLGSKVAEAWVKYTNSHGGVAGHPVELKITDTKGDPANGQSTATEYANDKSLV